MSKETEKLQQSQKCFFSFLCQGSCFLPFSLHFYSLLRNGQPCNILLSLPFSSTCPSPSHLFPFLYLSRNGYPFMQSFHFSTLLQAFCLELGQLKANNGGGGGKQKTNAETCAYEQILQDGEEKKMEYSTVLQFRVMVSTRNTRASVCPCQRPACSK